MVLFNYATRELTAKIVYYGPGLGGKTTNLEYIHKSLPEKTRGKMLSLSTQTDRTLFFDFLPIDLGSVKGMKTRVQLYTVPGQVFYDATRKLVLKGADGVVFVVDSQKPMLDSNMDSWENLKHNLSENGLDINTIPLVIQYNKRDLPDVFTVKEIDKKFNALRAPAYEAVAVSGQGVQETLKEVTRLVLKALSRRFAKEERTEEPRKYDTEAVEDHSELEEKLETVIPGSAYQSQAAVALVDEEVKDLPVEEELESAEESGITLEPVDHGEAVTAEELEELEEVPELQVEGLHKPVEAEEVQELREDVLELHEDSPAPESQQERASEVTSPPQEKAAQSEPAPVVSEKSAPETPATMHPSATPVHVDVQAAPNAQEYDVPVQISVQQNGQEVKLQITIQLRIKVV